MNKRAVLQMFLVALSSLAMASCSISYSGEKSSDAVSASLDSVSASFDSFSSVSDSSKGEDGAVSAAMNRFLDDVKAIAELWGTSSSEPEQLEHQLDALAVGYGISYWPMEPLVFRAVGSGLHQAGVAPEDICHNPILDLPVFQHNAELVLAGYREG